MSEIITVKDNGTPVYPIRIEPDFRNFNKVLEELSITENRICIVTDSTIGTYYLDDIQKIAKGYAREVETFILAPGEEYKNLNTVNRLYEQLIKARFDRQDVLVALGGGVVGDLTGFAAATYLRGIRYVQVPTTLLAMVDSSIGGKTGVDFMKYKNMVGAFYQPCAVYINLSALNTLKDRQFASGFGEIMKYGLIRDEGFYQWLSENREALLKRELSALEEAVARSCRHKQAVVEADPKEKGERALLNFGHTIGHAVEKLMDFKLLHGECVSVGMVAACCLSVLHGGLSEGEADEVRQELAAFGLPVSVAGLLKEQVVAVTKNDKKMNAGKIRFILLNGIGGGFIDENVTDEELGRAVSSVLKG